MTAGNRQTPLNELIIGAFPALDRQQQNVAVTTYRLLARGQPVSLDAIADEADEPSTDVETMFAELPGVFFDDQRRVVGFWGLSLGETRHCVELDGRTLFTWCAWDTLFIPLIVGAAARVVSRSPVDDAEVEVEVTRGGATANAEIMVSMVRPDPVTFQSNVISAFCHHIYFFESREAGESWAKERDDILLLTLDEAFALGKNVVGQVYGTALQGGVQ